MLDQLGDRRRPLGQALQQLQPRWVGERLVVGGDRANSSGGEAIVRIVDLRWAGDGTTLRFQAWRGDWLVGRAIYKALLILRACVGGKSSADRRVNTYAQADTSPGKRRWMTMAERRVRIPLPTRPRVRRPVVDAAEPAPEVSMEPRPEDVAAPVEASRCRRRGDLPRRPARSTARRPWPTRRKRLREVARTRWPGSACSGPPETSSARRRGVRAARARRRGRDRRPPAAQARALRRHAVRGAARRHATSTTSRRSSSARSTSSSARTSCSPSATAGRPTSAPCATAWRAIPSCSRRGPEAVLYAILDSVVDGYAPVVAGLQKDIDEIETEVFRGDPKVSRRIYELSGEVIEFQRATRPLLGMLDGARARASRSTAPTRSCSATCATWPTTRRPWPSASTASARTCPTS